MAYQDIIYEKCTEEPKIARITLNRPEKMNALSANLLNEVFDAVDKFDNDDGAIVLIIRGAGRAFSSGYDLGSPRTEAEATEQPQPTIGRSRRGMNASVERYIHLWNLRKPTIAQIHGYCLSGGTELSSMCDFIIAAENTAIGHIAGRYMGTLRTLSLWPLLAGMRRAKEMFMTGDFISGKQACDWGIVNRAVPEEQLEDEVFDFARRLIREPLEQLTLHKHSVNRWFEIMGIQAMLYSAADFDAVSSFMGQDELFRDIVKRDGLQAALAKMNDSWRKYERKPAPEDWKKRTGTPA